MSLTQIQNFMMNLPAVLGGYFVVDFGPIDFYYTQVFFSLVVFYRSTCRWVPCTLPSFLVFSLSSSLGFLLHLLGPT